MCSEHTVSSLHDLPESIRRFQPVETEREKKLFIRIATRNEMSEVKMCNSVKNIAIALHPMNF